MKKDTKKENVKINKNQRNTVENQPKGPYVILTSGSTENMIYTSNISYSIDSTVTSDFVIKS